MQQKGKTKIIEGPRAKIKNLWELTIPRLTEKSNQFAALQDDDYKEHDEDDPLLFE